MPERQRILISGASSGLGAGMAREWAARGRDLALCARRLDRLETLRGELLAAHPGIRVAIRALDVNDHDAVFRVVKELRAELGGLDRIVVNAGLGKGQPIGTGYFYANRQTAQTNFLGALAQCEAAVEVFREQDDGHLVVIASISALRGMRKNLTTYAASKAAVATLAEGIRSDLLRTPIRVTTIYPGYIESEMTARAPTTRFMVDNASGTRAIVRAIEREPVRAYVPWWPWAPIGFAMKRVPLTLVRRFF
ncbi:MAG TPA: SDR family oxidoreductase [Candidatus Thermoplasmatota archaeon]|nr:SDR family oxidoreductase [Candidatus Thermoplasmatota archaeon]